MVSMAGASHVSRVGMSFLTAIGLENLIALSPDAYVDIAVSLATDRQRLSSLRNDLRRMMARSPLMDGARLTRHLETALNGMLA
jgi:predicted O-linked N-acetylglucosamine transferase (SPINDLY family)